MTEYVVGLTVGFLGFLGCLILSYLERFRSAAVLSIVTVLLMSVIFGIGVYITVDEYRENACD